MTLRVAITGLHLGENSQPGPGVARSLRAALGASIEIIGLAYDVFDSSLYAEGLLDDAFMIPYPSAGPTAFAARLYEIQATRGLDVFLPCLDVEMPVVKRLAPQLEAHGIRTVLPSVEAFARRTKDRLPALATELGVATPKTIALVDRAALGPAVRELGFPLVIKGPFYEAEIAHSASEAFTAFERFAARWGLPVLAQKFITGEEFDVVALGDGNRACGAVAMRKTVLTKLGKAWGAVTIDDPELLGIAKRVVNELSWRGGCEVEMLRAKSDGQPYLIEINPRFPAWVYLATQAGANLPFGALQLALDRPVPDLSSYRPGVFYVRHATEVTGELGDIEALMTGGRLPGSRPGALDG